MPFAGKHWEGAIYWLTAMRAAKFTPELAHGATMGSPELEAKNNAQTVNEGEAKP